MSVDTKVSYPPLHGAALVLLTFSLSLNAFMQILDTSIANVSLPYIAGDLAVSNNQGTWVITSFAVGNATALPLTGWLSKRFGPIRLILAATLLFTLFSWLCGAAQNFPMLVGNRFLQGFVAGPLIPLSQSLLTLNYPKEKRKLAISLFFTVVVAAPVAGPILGGWITENYNWRWIFYINIPVGILSILLTWNVLRSRMVRGVKIPVDWVGLGLLLLGVGALQIMLDKGEQYDWFDSPLIRNLGVTSLISLTLLILWELTDKHPLIDLRLFKERNYAIGVFITSISYMPIFGGIVVIPLWLQTHMGYTSLWAGKALAFFGILPLLFTVGCVKLMEKFAIKWIVCTCFFLFFVAYLNLAFLNPLVPFSKIATGVFFLGAGLVVWLTPLVTIAHADIPEEHLSMATGIFHFCRIFCGGAGTSLIVYLWDRRAIFHHARLVETIRGVSQEPLKDLAKLDVLTTDQAYMLATNDIFWFSGWLCLFLMFFALAFKREKRTQVELLVG